MYADALQSNYCLFLKKLYRKRKQSYKNNIWISEFGVPVVDHKIGCDLDMSG